MANKEIFDELQRKSVMHDFIIDIFSEILVESGLTTEDEIVNRINDKIKEAVVDIKEQTELSKEGFSPTGEGGQS